MKKISMLLIILFITSPGYGDKWDDQYQAKLDSIQRFFDVSFESGFTSASDYAGNCFNYVLGFVNGSMANGNYRERESKRFADWSKDRNELSEKTLHFLKAGDYGNASYYAKKEFELSCQYEKTIRRETFK